MCACVIKQSVTFNTTIDTITLSISDDPWISCAMNKPKHMIAPVQSRAANPPNNCLRNLIISGVCLGGVMALGPSLCKTDAARSSLNPLK